MGIETQEYCLSNLQINGENIGLITMVEVITDEYVYDKYGNRNGNLYKPALDIARINYEGADLRYVDDKITSYNAIFENTKTLNTNDEDKQRLVNIIKNINNAQSVDEIEKNFIDFEKVIKIVAINKAVSNVDTFTGRTIRNFYLYEEDGKIDIIPFDFNISLGMRPKEFLWSEDEIYSFELDEEQYGIYSVITDIILGHGEYIELYNQYLNETLDILKEMKDNEYVDIVNDKIIDIVKNSTNENFSIEEHEIGIENLKKYLDVRSKSEVKVVGNN